MDTILEIFQTDTDWTKNQGLRQGYAADPANMPRAEFSV